jgi:2-polyprenyl-6-methoxyphenol hydroxylase-like FAD-dependent oxidoreductase
MGIVPRLRAAATRATAMRLIGPDGRPGIRVPMSASPSAAGTAEIEVPRADLAAILHGAARDHAEFIFGDTITALAPDPGGVDVTFAGAAPRRFDLVVGADGLHSTVRRLAFGPEERFVRHLGVYVATMPLGEPAIPHDEIMMYNTPGRLVSIHPSRDQALVAFIFRAPALAGFDHRDTAQHRRLILEAYGEDRAWRVPELLDRLRAVPDLYFDAVSKVVLPSWSTGRVTLLGDAAASVSLFGDGSSMAMAGARTLAEALAESDPATALRVYETRHRRRTDPRRRTARLAAAMIVPRTRAGLAVRNRGAGLLLARG